MLVLDELLLELETDEVDELLRLLAVLVVELLSVLVLLDDDSELVELDETLLDDGLLLLLLASSSWRPNTYTEYTTAPPLALNLTFFFVLDMSIAVSPDSNAMRSPPARKAPSLATVRLPNTLRGSAVPGSIWSRPSPLSCLMTISTASSNRHAWPNGSIPDPAPISIPVIWYRSSVSLAPEPSDLLTLAQPRFNSPLSMPLAMAPLMMLALSGCCVFSPESSVLTSVQPMRSRISQFSTERSAIRAPALHVGRRVRLPPAQRSLLEG